MNWKAIAQGVLGFFYMGVLHVVRWPGNMVLMAQVCHDNEVWPWEIKFEEGIPGEHEH